MPLWNGIEIGGTDVTLLEEMNPYSLEGIDADQSVIGTGIVVGVGGWSSGGFDVYSDCLLYNTTITIAEEFPRYGCYDDMNQKMFISFENGTIGCWDYSSYPPTRDGTINTGRAACSEIGADGPRDKLFVTTEDDKLIVIDTSTYTVSATIDFADTHNFYRVAMDTINGYAYLHETDLIMEIDCSDNSKNSSLDVATAQGICYDSDGYVWMAGSDYVWKFGTTPLSSIDVTGVINADFACATGGLLTNANTDYVYALGAGAWKYVAIIQKSDCTFVGSISVPHDMDGGVLSADGKYIIATANTDNNTMLIDVFNELVVQDVSTNSITSSYAWMAEGKLYTGQDHSSEDVKEWLIGDSPVALTVDFSTGDESYGLPLMAPFSSHFTFNGKNDDCNLTYLLDES